MSVEIKLFTRWRVEANLSEIAAILGETGAYASWWGEAWAHSQEIDPGDAAGLGKTSALTPRRCGRLGVRALSMRLVEDDRPRSWGVEINGDLSGQGSWSLYQDGPVAEVGHEWRVVPRGARLRLLGPLGRLFCRRCLRRVMRSGEAALTREIARRRSHRSG